MQWLMELVMGVFGGVGLFLLGMKFLSEGMQALAGPRLAGFVRGFTGNRLLALLAGIVVTLVFQSSSATTVLVVGFVNGGTMTLLSALGVSLGAHVGTTLSLWVLALDVTRFALLVVGVAAFGYLFAKRERLHNAGRALLGLGLLFYGMQLMQSGFGPLRDATAVREFLAGFDATTMRGFVLAALAGAFVTAVIQSSAAMVVIVMSLGANGLVSFPTAAALVVGSNVGTTATGLLACIGSGRSALRAALGNSLVSAVGVAVVCCVHSAFVALCRHASQTLAGPLAWSDPAFVRVAIPCTHTLFNVCTTIILFPLLPALERALLALLPQGAAERREADRFRVALDPRLARAPAAAVLPSGREVLRMGAHCGRMLEDIRAIVLSDAPDAAREQAVFDAEDDLDVAQAEIARYLGRILERGGGKLPSVATAIRRQIRCADEFESVSDYIRAALKAFLKIRNAGERLSDEARKEVLVLADAVDSFRQRVLDILAADRPSLESLAAAHAESRSIADLAREYRHRHLDRLERSCSGPVKGVLYNDLLAAFRRMNEHLVNAVETLEGK